MIIRVENVSRNVDNFTGHPAVVITAVTNGDDFSSVEAVGAGDVTPGDAVLKVQK